MKNVKYKIKNGTSGFTLIELLIALSVGLVMLMAVFNLTLLARKAVALSVGRGELTQNGRLALERMARDLRQAQMLVTRLPASAALTGFPPPAQLEFQDGHDPASLTYLRYHLLGNALYRESSYYSFSSAPGARVPFNIRDAQSNFPIKTVLEDAVIADSFQSLQFFGVKLITVRADLLFGTIRAHLETAILARNLPGSGN